jgi:predicted MPP superfamily phosphohydrolase
MKFIKCKKYFILILLVNFLIPGSAQEIKFGVITDVHHGYLTDVSERLQIFIDVANEEEVDFIIELGDITLFMNEEHSGSFLDIWDSFNGPKYKVLGNHDMDNNSKQEALDYLGMESNYYTFDMHGIHFIVMDDNHIKDKDGNLIDYDNGNYFGANRDWFGDEQLAWVTQDLANTDRATVIFRHAGIHGKEQKALENIVAEANSNAGYKKVLLGLNGHGHDNEEEIADNVPYVEIPSASYVWENHQAEPYTKVQFAIVTINTTDGTLVIDGRAEDVEYQEGLPTHNPVITDKSYTFLPIGIRSSFTPTITDCSASVSFTNTSSESCL